MMKNKIALLLAFLLAACAPSAQSVQTAIVQTVIAWTPVPTQTAYPTYTAAPTIYVTQIVLVTSTFTVTPPGPSKTPSPTDDLPASATAYYLSKIKDDKTDGIYLVNIDIAPGVWRSYGVGDKCYWSKTTRTGDIIDNFIGPIGGTIYIAPSDFQVQFERCGTWKYLGPP